MKSQVYSILATCTLAAACGSEPSPAPTTKEPSSSDALENLSSKAPSAALRVNTPIDPSLARATLVSQPSIGLSSAESRLKIPLLSLSFSTADYVQILRCKKGFELKSPSGEPISEIPATSATRLDQMKYAFLEAFSDTNQCSIAGSKVSRESWQDLAAETGTFFYVLNPCVESEHSSKKSEQCSYNLLISDSISYQNALSKEFIAKAKELADAEAGLAGIYSQLYDSAYLISLKQNECEKRWAVENSIRNFWKGLGTVLITGVGGAIGTAMSGGTAALSGAKTAMGIALGLFSKTPDLPLKCPAVESLYQEAITREAQLKPAIEAVLTKSAQLSELNSTYAKIDQSILEQNR